MPERNHDFSREHVPEYSFDQARAQMATLLHREMEDIPDEAVDKFLELTRQHRDDSHLKVADQRVVAPFKVLEKHYAELAIGKLPDELN
ncbi:MAG: hypothetical protein WCW16_01350 [Candidatus Magasanikbacteria bacterium]|jgi:hypothetical protein